jgi:carbonic anhydrase
MTNFFRLHNQPEIDQDDSNLEAAGEANPEIRAALQRKASIVISSMVKDGKRKIVAGFHDLCCELIEVD